MPNKDAARMPLDPRVAIITTQHGASARTPVAVPKSNVMKAIVKETPMSPPPAPTEPDLTELLGSLTTQQQQRMSARVIKKLRLEPQPDREKRDTECETPIKVDEKELKFPTVKQRMPKALWSADEKSLFFEALNEYGKDFDAITTYIYAKMKKKGMPDLNLKTKTQVSHFYYRTWHKLSKHVQFDENVKKVAQELYALINYGELRKKLVSINEKTCARLGEMVLCGSMVVRHRGRNVRVRTPMCRALRKLNQITERLCGARVCTRAQIVLRARNTCAWARVQAAAHNPRAAVSTPLRTELSALIKALSLRWKGYSSKKKKSAKNNETRISLEETPLQSKASEEDHCIETAAKQNGDDGEEKNDLQDHLNLETDQIIVQEQKLPKKPVLHLGPRPNADIHLPVISPNEQLSSQNICFTSYVERMREKDRGRVKIRTPKRQRKDSLTEKEKEHDSKKQKTDDSDKLICIDDIAIDGIELMASYKTNQEDDEKPSTEDEKDLKSEETAEEDVPDVPERDRDMSEKEKDSFSEMEDDEKYNKSDTDNESDHGKTDKSLKEQQFRNLKVKFRIRSKSRGGTIYTVVTDKEPEVIKIEEPAKEEPTKEEIAKEESSKEEEIREEERRRSEVDVDTAIKQIKRGWSVHDAGDLTVGDLYLMFGSRSKIELDYWWAEPTPPYVIEPTQKPNRHTSGDKLPLSDKDRDKRATESSIDDEKDRARESDTYIFSPKNMFNQDSNDGISGDERKVEPLASPEHKLPSSCSATLRLTSKLINRPSPPPQNTHSAQRFSLLSERLKRLLALVGNPHVTSGTSSSIARCNCGHVCPQQRRQQKPQLACSSPYITSVVCKAEPEANPPVFRHPTPIAPKVDNQMANDLSLDGIPKWRRGRPRADKRVVVQRLLPLLPKLPPPSSLIPVKIVPNPRPVTPRLLPKVSPTSASNLPYFYVVSESNGQFYYHDGDNKIPIVPDTVKIEPQAQGAQEEESIKEENKTDIQTYVTRIDVTGHMELTDPNLELKKEEPTARSLNSGSTDVPDCPAATSGPPPDFLPSESMSLSPSRLLRDADGWLEGSVQDFSLSSFLGHLEGRPQQDLAVDSQLQSLLAESSVDYVAKFADLAAKVDTLASDDLA